MDVKKEVFTMRSEKGDLPEDFCPMRYKIDSRSRPKETKKARKTLEVYR